MANNAFTKQSLNLLSPICMDINDSVVRPFDSFNKKNAPYIGDQLSPFYVSREKTIGFPYFTRNGDKWTVEANRLCKNGVAVPGKELRGGVTPFNKPANYQTLWGDRNFTEVGEEAPQDWRFVSLRRKKTYTYVDGKEQEVYEYYIHNNTSFSEDVSCRDLFSVKSAVKVVSSASFSQNFDHWFFIFIIDFEKSYVRVYKVLKDGQTKHVTWIPLARFEMQGQTDSDVVNPYITCVKLPNGMYALSAMATSGTRITKRLKPYNFIVKSFEPFEIITNITTGYDNGELLQFYTFPFYFDYAVKSAPKAPLVPAVYYVGKYDDIQGEDTKPIFYFGNAHVDSVDILDTTAQLTLSFEKWFQDEKILKNDKEIRKKIAVSYTLYDNYYHQVGAIKRKEGNDDIFIPFNFYKKYNVGYVLGLNDDLFNGVNMDSTDITENTVVYNDLPDTSVFNFERYGKDNVFYLNINNGYITGLSSDTGCLIAPWYSFNEGFYVTKDNICLHRNDGSDLLLGMNTSAEIKTIYNDRYVLINSTSALNAYDIKTGRWFNWCSGYNGNIGILTGWLDVNTRPTQEQLEEGGKKSNNILLLATAENANYEVNALPFISSIFPYTRLLGVVKSLNPLLPYIVFVPSSYGFREIDIYKAYGDKATAPVYSSSYKYLTEFVKPELTGLVYPESTNIILTISLSVKFIKSYNNHDFIIEDGKGYPLIYSNNYPIFGYKSLSFIEGIKDIFVIQNSNYLIFDNKIMSVAFQGDQLISNTIVCDITGMDFIGNTSQVAFFFSRLVKKIYTFTGDVILREQRGANVIEEVYKTFFIPADNTILLSCKEYDGKDYVYFFGNDSFLKFEQKRVVDAFFADNKIILIGQDNTISKYSYFKREGFDKLPIELQTGFFGLGNEMSAILDCWYIRVFSESHEFATITVKQNVITNIGVKGETKKITVSQADWDEVSHSYLIRYQPRYQCGVGFQLEIKSDVAIYEIVASYRQGETQLTSPKAQI